MDNCSRCDELPDEFPESGTLLIHAGLEHTTSKLRRVFEQEELSCETKDDVLEVSFTSDALKALVEPLRDELSRSEREDTRVVLMTGNQEPTAADLIGARSLQNVLGQVNGTWLIDLIREERLFNVFQPIVNPDQPDDVFGYECLLRGKARDGTRIGPGRIFSTAEQADLVFQLDRQARILAVNNTTSNDIRPEQKIFINFLPTSIYDPEFCLNTTLKAVRNADAEPGQFVFEVVESEEVDDREKLKDIISYYREKGFRVALDDFGAGYSSLRMLSEIRPDFLKLDMGLVQDIPGNAMNAELCEQILNVSSKHDVTTLAEGIETEEQLHWFRKRDLDLAQGYLFAKPAVPPPVQIAYTG